MKLRPALPIILANLLLCLLVGAACEIMLRFLLFSEISAAKPLRQARFYADSYSEDAYWKLRYLFGKAYPVRVHPLLGWVKPTIDPATLDHARVSNLGSRIPVLLYGDSFAECVIPKEDCFDGIMDRDVEINGQYYLINYGVAGYGLDQIYLLLKKSIDGFQDPAVIISLLDFDLDRSFLAVRDGPKPYFVLDKGRLELRGIPVDSDLDTLYASHPPQIRCYLCKALMRALPAVLGAWLADEPTVIAKKIEINRAIVLEIVQELEKRNLKYVFLVFEKSAVAFRPPGWRLNFLMNLFREHHIPHILARDVIVPHAKKYNLGYQEYELGPRDYHPTPLYNRLVATRLRNWLINGRNALTDPANHQSPHFAGFP